MFLKSPAKVNLFLEVIGKRPDGYHEIETIFQAIDLCDEIELTEKDEDIELACDSPLVPGGEDNLAYQAALVLKEQAGIQRGVRIKIKKRIPVASGLGGGSSNAGVVLRGLNRLWELNWDIGRLLELGERIGADVPFFVSGFSSALGKGRGDKITEIPPGARLNRNYRFILLSPRLAVPTALIYRNLRCPLTRKRSSVKILDALHRGSVAEIGRLAYNRLEEVTSEKFREVKEVKDALKDAGAKFALVSGSGPTVFTISEDEAQAEKILKMLPGGNWQVFKVKALSATLEGCLVR